MYKVIHLLGLHSVTTLLDKLEKPIAFLLSFCLRELNELVDAVNVFAPDHSHDALYSMICLCKWLIE